MMTKIQELFKITIFDTTVISSKVSNLDTCDNNQISYPIKTEHFHSFKTIF